MVTKLVTRATSSPQKTVPTRLLCFALAAWCVYPVMVFANDSALPLTPIESLRLTKRQDAEPRMMVRTQGVVSMIGEGMAPYSKGNGALEHFCIEKDGVGIWIGTRRAIRDGVWQGDTGDLSALVEGDEVELEGVLIPGLFSPMILPKSVKVVGKTALPRVPPTELRSFLNGGSDCQRVLVNGVIQSVEETGEYRWLLRVETGLGYFITHVPKGDVFSPETLLDAEVELRGLCVTSFNQRAEFVRPRLILGKEADFTIRRAPNPDPFSAPKIGLETLDGYTVGGRPRHRQRVEGVVTYVSANGFLVIQRQDCAIRIKPSGSSPFVQGDVVEASGFIETSRVAAGLGGAVLRKVGTAPQPEPIQCDIARIRADFNALKIGTTPGHPSSYDDLLVAIEGTILSIQTQGEGGTQLEIQSGDSVSSALVAGPIGSLSVGSVIRATGVAVIQYNPTTRWAMPERLDLLLRNQDDIRVLQAPSWWTAERSRRALLGVLITCLAVAGWAFALRRTVKIRTQQLAREIRKRRDAAVEYEAGLRERSRLSANLHDTVLQTVTGLSFQIKACEAKASPLGNAELSQQLSVAWKMAQRGQEDLRNSVWALKALPIKEGNFSDAVRSVATRLTQGRSVEMEVSASDLPELPDFVAGNLLLVIQEAIHNALKHANPSRIELNLSVATDGSRITARVKDNGPGFELEAIPGAAEGHFGVDGMKERMELIGGIFTLRSDPSFGTIVEVDVPLHSFDHEISED